jgi:dihydropteroate synthase
MERQQVIDHIKKYTINIHGRLLNLDRPRVMGILNATPDSFYAESRMQTETAIALRAHDIVAQGGSIIDVGGCSTRPGGELPSQEEEMGRLKRALAIVRRDHPDVPLSVDTFRPDVARMAVEEFGADIINDVSGGSETMFRMAARLGVPYILTSTDASLRDMLLTLAQKVQQLRDYGQKDLILDPGFGFGKTVEENYEVMSQLEKLQVMGLPVLAGVSRKSMIYRLLHCTPDESLNATTMLNTIALMKGASILRVHDVREAAECCRLYETLKGQIGKS